MLRASLVVIARSPSIVNFDYEFRIFNFGFGEKH